MKAKLYAGALAFALWGGGALAQDWQQEPQSPPDDADVTVDTQQESADVRDTEEAYGGSGTSDAFATKDTRSQDIDGADKEDKDDKTGLTVLLGGGVEGYTGQLAPAIDPGVAWGVSANIRPTRILGIELGYSGAANVIDSSRNAAEDLRTGGADLIRNGGYAALTLGLTTTDIQPYILGGVGVSRYSVRGDAEAVGFRDDTVGAIPVGGGLRAHLGDFTADARLTMNPLLGNQLAPHVNDGRIDTGNGVAAGGRYSATLQLGTTF